MLRKLIALIISLTLCIFFAYLGFEYLDKEPPATAIILFAFSLMFLWGFLYSCGIKITPVIYTGTICLVLTIYIFSIDPEKITYTLAFAWPLSVLVFISNIWEYFETRCDEKNLAENKEAWNQWEANALSQLKTNGSRGD